MIKIGAKNISKDEGISKPEMVLSEDTVRWNKMALANAHMAEGIPHAVNVLVIESAQQKREKFLNLMPLSDTVDQDSGPFFYFLRDLSCRYFAENYITGDIQNLAFKVDFGSALNLDDTFTIPSKDVMMLTQNYRIKDPNFPFDHSVPFFEDFYYGVDLQFVSSRFKQDPIGDKMRELIFYVDSMENSKTYQQMLPHLEPLWEAFPLTDTRIEIAYSIFKRSNKIRILGQNHTPIENFNFDPQLLFWSMEKGNAQNIALRMIYDFIYTYRLHEKPKNTRLVQRDVKDVFHFRARKECENANPLYLARRLHDALLKSPKSGRDFIKDPIKFLYEKGGLKEVFPGYGLKEFRQWHNSIGDSKSSLSRSLIQSHSDLANGNFFNSLYCQKYRSVRDVIVQNNCVNTPNVSFAHPVYSLASYDIKELSRALVASTAEDRHIFRNFDERLPMEHRTISLNREQLAAQQRLEYLVRRGRKDDEKIELTIHNIIEEAKRDPLTDPNVTALYRIFMAPQGTSFFDKVGLIGLPFENNSKLALKEMKKLIEWLNASGENTANRDHVARAYLTAAIRPYFKKFISFYDLETFPDFLTIVDNLTTASLLGTQNLEKCPELLLARCFNPTNEHKHFNFIDFDTYEFPRSYQNVIENYRFGDKCISDRQEFISNLGKIMDNYRSIRSGDWGENLDYERQLCCKIEERTEKFKTKGIERHLSY